MNNLSIVFAAQPIYLCPVDLHKLQHLCGFNIVERYKKVNNLLKKKCNKARWEYLHELANDIYDNREHKLFFGITYSLGVKDQIT